MSVLWTILLMVLPLVSTSNEIKITKENIDKYEEMALEYLKKHNASNFDIIQRYFYASEELAANSKYSMAARLMKKGLDKYSKNEPFLVQRIFICEMYLRSNNLRESKNCSQQLLNQYQNDLLRGDVEGYINILLIRVRSSSQKYTQNLTKSELKIVLENQREKGFIYSDFLFFFKSQRFNEALSAIDNLVGSSQDYDYAILYDYLVYKTGEKRRKKCMDLYKKFAENFGYGLPKPSENVSLDLCRELSKKKPNELQIRNIIQKLDKGRLNILKNVIGS